MLIVGAQMAAGRRGAGLAGWVMGDWPGYFYLRPPMGAAYAFCVAALYQVPQPAPCWTSSTQRQAPNAQPLPWRDAR